MRGKILIADDDSQSRLLLRLFCERWGYEVIEASDGKEAVELATRELPSVILMDAMMPVIDGFEAVRILRSRERTKDIPVVIVTAFGEDCRECIEDTAHVHALLSKPMDMESLRSILEELTG